MSSINDVARHAGVSATTVSHALSGKRAVSAAVRARVEAAMGELGYVPSRSAQSLASGRTRLIGLVVPDIANGFFAELARGVEREATSAGHNIVLCTTGFDHEREIGALELVKSRAFDGVVYAAGSPPTGSELTSLLGGLPVVLVDEEVSGASAPLFVSDNHAGGRLAAEHLLGLGHRRAVVVGGPDELASSRHRCEAFIQAWLASTGTRPEIAHGAFSVRGGREATGAHLPALTGTGAEDRATAVFAANDLMALGVLEQLDEAGVPAPDRVSVVGFDDIEVAQFCAPRLTTVRQDVSTLGARAAACLLAALEASTPAPPPARTHVLPVELVVRLSTATRS